METSINFLENFKKEGHERLLNLFEQSGIMTRENSETTIHGLIDILESIEKVYSIIIPQIIATSSNEVGKIEDLINELKTQFSHIEYHIEDAKLSGLKYW